MGPSHTVQPRRQWGGGAPRGGGGGGAARRPRNGGVVAAVLGVEVSRGRSGPVGWRWEGARCVAGEWEWWGESGSRAVWGFACRARGEGAADAHEAEQRGRRAAALDGVGGGPRDVAERGERIGEEAGDEVRAEALSAGFNAVVSWGLSASMEQTYRVIQGAPSGCARMYTECRTGVVERCRTSEWGEDVRRNLKVASGVKSFAAQTSC